MNIIQTASLICMAALSTAIFTMVLTYTFFEILIAVGG